MTAAALLLTTIFAAAPPVASSEVSPSKILPPSATGGAAASERYPDPKACTVVVDAIGKVGFRIADAQSLTNAVLMEMRSRVGREGAVYEGTLISDKKMTRMLDGSESEIRTEKMDYYRAAIKNAKHRVKMKFGKKRRTHFIELTCRTQGERRALDKVKVTAPNFRGALTKLKGAMSVFCLQIAKKAPPKPATIAPKKKKKKAWSMPPRRD